VQQLVTGVCARRDAQQLPTSARSQPSHHPQSVYGWNHRIIDTAATTLASHCHLITSCAPDWFITVTDPNPTCIPPSPCTTTSFTSYGTTQHTSRVARHHYMLQIHRSTADQNQVVRSHVAQHPMQKPQDVEEPECNVQLASAFNWDAASIVLRNF